MSPKTELKNNSKLQWMIERDQVKERLAIAMELNRDLKTNVAHLEYDRIYHQKNI